MKNDRICQSEDLSDLEYLFNSRNPINLSMYYLTIFNSYDQLVRQNKCYLFWNCIPLEPMVIRIVLELQKMKNLS